MKLIKWTISLHRCYSITCICYKASNSFCIFLGNNKSTTGILSTSLQSQQANKNKFQTDMLGTKFAHQRDLGLSTEIPVWKYDFFVRIVEFLLEKMERVLICLCLYKTFIMYQWSNYKQYLECMSCKKYVFWFIEKYVM